MQGGSSPGESRRLTIIWLLPVRRVANTPRGGDWRADPPPDRDPNSLEPKHECFAAINSASCLIAALGACYLASTLHPPDRA